MTPQSPEDILKVKVDVRFFVFNIWRDWHEKMEHDHEENDSSAFVRNDDISDDAGAGAGTGAE